MSVGRYSKPKQCRRLYTLPYWSNPLIFDIRVLWCSVLSARAPECQKLVGSMAKCKALMGSAVKGLKQVG